MSARELIILGCSGQQPTRARNQGAYLLRWNSEGFLFDPGEGTQRQFIFADVSPTSVTRIFISHFHGDHCLGLGSMLMRLNLDKVSWPIHCYYPASGKKYFDRLRYSTIYHETIKVIEHPIKEEGIVESSDDFCIEAAWLKHPVDTLGWRITEANTRKLIPEKLTQKNLKGPIVKELLTKGQVKAPDGTLVSFNEVGYVKHGASVSVIADTLPCKNIEELSRNARLMLCESTYLNEHKHLALSHSHMTAKDAATIAAKANAQELILTHFSARYTHLQDFEKEARAIFPNTHVAEEFRRFPFPKNE
ncbi:ribonuclease Z [Chlamydiifrater phoenicopteri]|uniref:ribonuclease Z n=1 Tax=Chlamydiifrater phoenicopteri TaxID=2681469 RepID=UPI001BD0497A|nr:ribonuclease Z [Chlamydiifrater phoenicopteri]